MTLEVAHTHDVHAPEWMGWLTRYVYKLSQEWRQICCPPPPPPPPHTLPHLLYVYVTTYI